MSAIQTSLTTVPYSGTGPAMNALLGGQVDLMCDQTANTTPHIITGKVKVYGVTSRTRIQALRFVPTLDEAGLKNFELVVWHGLYAPKGTPKPVVDKLITVLQEAVKDPTFKSQLSNIGAEPVPVAKANPESLRNHLKSEIEKWAKIIKAAGVPVN